MKYLNLTLVGYCRKERIRGLKFKLTKSEKSWVLYDVGNSAFTMLAATLVPIYFNYLAENAGISSVDYLAYWGYAASVATLLVALLGPTLGSIADTKGYKRPVFVITLMTGAFACIGLGASKQWLIFLIVYILAKVAYSASLVFYDSMLSDVTTEERMDKVSTDGYAWGYIGSCIPFGATLVLILGAGKIGISLEMAMGISFGIIALWWLGLSTPLLQDYRQKHYVEQEEHVVLESFKRLGRTFKNIRKEKNIFVFLLAFFFYIDGVYTIIDMATAYGAALGLNSAGLLLALLVTQVVAFPFAILFGRLAEKYATSQLITICIVAYFGIAVFAMFMTTQLQFWILAVLVGMFQGGIQALSRSYFAKIIPTEQAGEYFGLFDICGKGASFMGTTVVGIVAQLTGNINLGVGAIAIFFVVGLIFFHIAAKLNASAQ